MPLLARVPASTTGIADLAALNAGAGTPALSCRVCAGPAPGPQGSTMTLWTGHSIALLATAHPVVLAGAQPCGSWARPWSVAAAEAKPRQQPVARWLCQLPDGLEAQRRRLGAGLVQVAGDLVRQLVRRDADRAAQAVARCTWFLMSRAIARTPPIGSCATASCALGRSRRSMSISSTLRRPTRGATSAAAALSGSIVRGASSERGGAGRVAGDTGGQPACRGACAEVRPLSPWPNPALARCRPTR